MAQLVAMAAPAELLYLAVTVLEATAALEVMQEMAVRVD